MRENKILFFHWKWKTIKFQEPAEESLGSQVGLRQEENPGSNGGWSLSRREVRRSKEENQAELAQEARSREI